MKLHQLVLAVATVALIAPGTASADDPITQLGAGVVPAAISTDGTAVAGTFNNSQAFKWSTTEGLMVLGGLQGADISADGMVVAGNIEDNTFETAAYWNEIDNWVPLGSVPGGESCDAFLSSSWGTDDDGSVVVGLGWVANCRAHAIRWEESTGVVDLGSTVPDRSSRANEVSDDGEVVVGWQDASDGFRQGAYWVNGVQSILYEAADNAVGEAQRANSDGSIIVGGSTDLGFAYRYFMGDDFVEDIGGLSGFNWRSTAFGVSEDGGVIVGLSGFGFDRAAFIWTEDLGMMSLQDYVTDLGIPIPAGWVFSAALDVSADGSIITGYATDASFNFQGFIIDFNKPVGIEIGGPAVVSNFQLASAPNPFQANTSITYTLNAADQVTLGVYDASGRNVRSLFTGSADAGQHTVAWDGRDAQSRKVAPGVYFVRMMGTQEQTTSRITYLR